MHITWSRNDPYIYTHDHWNPFRRSNRLSYQTMSSTCTQSQLCAATPVSPFVQCPTSFRPLPSSVATFISIEIFWANHMSVAEWTDTYGIHHRKIIWSRYRKLEWVGFEPTSTKIRSGALTNWAIRPWVQLALWANFVQLLQLHRLLSVRLHFGHCLRQSPRLIQLKFFRSNHMSVLAQKISIEINVATDEGNGRNEVGHWTNGETGVAAQSWLWVQVELMVW